MNANKNNLNNVPAKKHMPGMPKSGTTWQEWSASSVIKDDEAKAIKQRPCQEEGDSQNAPQGNFPY